MSYRLPSPTAKISATVVLIGLAGCQCLPGTDRWFAFVDRVSRPPGRFEQHYNPGTDLTRLGRPDGNRFPNNVICPPGCPDCPPVRDVPVPQFRIYPQPTTLAGAKESFDDTEEEVDLDAVPLVPPEATEEVETPGDDGDLVLPDVPFEPSGLR